MDSHYLNVKGKGYGQETLEMLKSWAFDDLKFHRAWLDCKDHNTRALHVYEKLVLSVKVLFVKQF